MPDMAGVPNHDGTRRDSADRFFGHVDARIGRVLSASTSLGRRGQHDDLIMRGLFALIAGCATQFLAMGPGSKWTESPAWLWFVSAAVTAATFRLMGPNPRCSYVGDRGAVLIERRLRLISRTRVVIYDDAWDVRVVYTRVFKRGYSGTNAKFTWVDDEGKPVVSIDGAFREYRIDREEIDLDAIDRLEASHPVVALHAAARAFHDFVDAENATEAEG